VTETAKLAIISDVNHEMYWGESKMCGVTSTATAICWRCTKLHGATSQVEGEVMEIKLC